MTITACTLDAVQTVFVDLFCSPKSSMQNSLFVSGHDGSTNRTFIVEDYPEDEYGQWATEEVTGEQGYIDDERSCFWTWDDTEFSWQSKKFQDRQVKRRKGKGEGEGKGGFKRTGKAHFGEEQTQDLEWWSEEDSVWSSKDKKGKKASSKGKNNLPESEFRNYHPEKGTDNE